MWVRGLKQILNDGEKRKYMSHPMWVRGLKHRYYEVSKTLVGRTLCGCVD